mmetsp:Transcript_58163/g.92408  ORF Transcript_58163/g.92408 Transcript_58163/m.92408 type:complete len:187 (-) Transcript_58163:145-705(-)
MQLFKRLKPTPLLARVCKYHYSHSNQANLILNKGGCHCGNIRYEYRSSTPLKEWHIRECQCSFCRKHSSCSVSDHNGEIDIFCEEESLYKYQFETKSCDFWMCAHCGTYVSAVSNDEKLAAINANTLDNHAELLELCKSNKAAKQPVNYDNETEEQRVERRQQVWTPVHKMKMGKKTIVNGMQKFW